MKKRYRVTLTEVERDNLRKLVSVGKAAAQKLVRARILLLAHQAEGGSSKSDPEIVESLVVVGPVWNGFGSGSGKKVWKQRSAPSRASECLSGRWTAKRRLT